MRRSSSIVTLGLAILLVFAFSGSGFAISGLATGGPAVQAQYPDARSGLPVEDAPDVTIAWLNRKETREVRKATPSPAEEAKLVARTTAALSVASGPGIREYGSIPLLLSAIAVLSVAGVLRQRRIDPTLP